jgi:hypothetical protein
MPRRAQFLRELEGDDRFGVLLLAQLDAVPETLQLIVTTTQLDPATGGLRDVGQYIIRAIGVAEHRLTLGLLTSVETRTDHPLLYQYNSPPVGLFFRGEPDDGNALLADVLQAYASTFGPWRQPPTYLNVARPLHNLLTSGGDLIGQMPRPLAENLSKTLEAHGLETRSMEEPLQAEDEHGRSRLRTVMLLDESYIVAFDFTVEMLGKGGGDRSVAAQ